MAQLSLLSKAMRTQKSRKTDTSNSLKNEGLEGDTVNHNEWNVKQDRLEEQHTKDRI